MAADDELDDAPEDFDDELDEEIDEEIAEDLEDDDEDEDDADDDEYEDDDGFAGDDDDDDDDDDRDEALEELEAEELEIEDDPETLLVDEAAEIREMRRDELGLDPGSQEVKATEFVCSECFLVKSTTQLANKSRRICRDCV